MGTVDDARAALAAVERFSRESQCAAKFPWLSKRLAENFLLLTGWRYPLDERPLVAYPCPHCSTDRYVLWHIGHELEPRKDTAAS